MKAIKNFIYLDEYKMYSLSSQIFEGITEYLIEHTGKEDEEHESQRGPVGSGRIMADIIRKSSETVEKKVLNDYSYHLFEERLLQEQRVLQITGSTLEHFETNITKFSFMKVAAKAIFNDISSIKNTLLRFNEIGQAFTRVTNYGALQEVQKQFEAAQATIKDKNQKHALQSKLKSLTNISELAKKEGMQHDQKYLEALEMLLSYGYQDQFEIQLRVKDYIFSADLKRNSLRESENSLIRKYSRLTEKEFVIFGMITQSSKTTGSNDKQQGQETNTLKEALLSLYTMLSELEGSFTGRLANEIILDPIAVYTEV